MKYVRREWPSIALFVLSAAAVVFVTLAD